MQRRTNGRILSPRSMRKSRTRAPIPLPSLAQWMLAVVLAACGGGSVDDEPEAASPLPPALEGRDFQQGPIDRGGGAPPRVGTQSTLARNRDGSPCQQRSAAHRPLRRRIWLAADSHTCGLVARRSCAELRHRRTRPAGRRVELRGMGSGARHRVRLAPVVSQHDGHRRVLQRTNRPAAHGRGAAHRRRPHDQRGAQLFERGRQFLRLPDQLAAQERAVVGAAALVSDGHHAHRWARAGHRRARRQDVHQRHRHARVVRP